MGSGKSYWGKLWAAQSGLQFFDLDTVIEAAAHKTIAQLFEEKGEAWFRQKETGTLKTLAAKSNCIIACGGGTPCFNDNMDWMNDNGTTVYLKASPGEIFERVITEQEKRPLIKDLSSKDLLHFITQKLQERERYYSRAKIILPVHTLTAQTITAIQTGNENE